MGRFLFPFATAVCFFLGSHSWAQEAPEEAAPVETELSAAENADIEKALQNFYSQNPGAMDRKIPKFSVEDGKLYSPNPKLKGVGDHDPDPLLVQAQAKGSDSFQEKNCNDFLKKKFPKLKCDGAGGKATAEANDKIEDLTDTWIDEKDIVRDMTRIRMSGKSQMPLWSDDYWRTQWGGASYRYSQYDPNSELEDWKTAIGLYSQPNQFFDLVKKRTPPDKLNQTIDTWSPTEKYDLAVGDPNFTLTNQQKASGRSQLGKDNNVEPWIGLCHGWAPAGLMVPRPSKTVANIEGPNGTKVNFYPHDIRALATLNWANGSSDSNFVGGRCDAKKVARFPNGRVSQQECFDNNPATFHLALANMIGEKKLSFVMDKTFDFEVWNQDVKAYKFVYFNPLNPSERTTSSRRWQKYAVDYAAAFKKRDRFQKPLTRGLRNGKKWRDDGIKKVIGVIATVVYSAEVFPNWGKRPAADRLVRYTATYDLELHEEGGKLVPKGGEWHDNNHPDFLWIPRKESYAFLDADREKLKYRGKLTSAVQKKLNEVAPPASDQGYPLCQVVSYLVEQSSGQPYECRTE
jgi:hypothetical protein